MRGRKEEAARAWDALDVPSADREKVENETELGVVGGGVPGAGAIEVAGSPETTKKGAGWWDAFAPDVRARTLLGAFAMGMQQMSGIDGVLYVQLPLFTPRVPSHLTSPSTPPSSSNAQA